MSRPGLRAARLPRKDHLEGTSEKQRRDGLLNGARCQVQAFRAMGGQGPVWRRRAGAPSSPSPYHLPEQGPPPWAKHLRRFRESASASASASGAALLAGKAYDQISAAAVATVPEARFPSFVRVAGHRWLWIRRGLFQVLGFRATATVEAHLQGTRLRPPGTRYGPCTSSCYVGIMGSSMAACAPGDHCVW